MRFIMQLNIFPTILNKIILLKSIEFLSILYLYRTYAAESRLVLDQYFASLAITRYVGGYEMY